MPVGGFLDSLPSFLFITAHVFFLVVGLWAMRRAGQTRLPFTSAFWLYVVSQVGFLAFFGGALTLKMAVLLEQTLMLIFVVLLVRKPVA
jgi:hypothetical protein